MALLGFWLLIGRRCRESGVSVESGSSDFGRRSSSSRKEVIASGKGGTIVGIKLAMSQLPHVERPDARAHSQRGLRTNSRSNILLCGI